MRHLWPYNPVHTCIHVCACLMFPCVRINDDDDDAMHVMTAVACSSK